MVYEGNRRSNLRATSKPETIVTRPDAGWLPPKEHFLLSLLGAPTRMRPPADRTRTLETGPVDLVARLFGRQPAVRVFGGCAVIDDAVDFASDRHGKPVLLGEFHDDAGGLDTLCDLIHRRDDLVDRLACAQLLADMAVAAALARARDDQIADAGQARKVSRCPPAASHLGHFTDRAGHHHRARVFADTE